MLYTRDLDLTSLRPKFPNGVRKPRRRPLACAAPSLSSPETQPRSRTTRSCVRFSSIDVCRAYAPAAREQRADRLSHHLPWRLLPLRRLQHAPAARQAQTQGSCSAKTQPRDAVSTYRPNLQSGRAATFSLGLPGQQARTNGRKRRKTQLKGCGVNVPPEPAERSGGYFLPGSVQLHGSQTIHQRVGNFRALNVSVCATETASHQLPHRPRARPRSSTAPSPLLPPSPRRAERAAHRMHRCCRCASSASPPRCHRSRTRLLQHRPSIDLSPHNSWPQLPPLSTTVLPS